MMNITSVFSGMAQSFYNQLDVSIEVPVMGAAVSPQAKMSFGKALKPRTLVMVGQC